MTIADRTLYDEVSYLGHAYPFTHPDHLASIAYLFGLDPAAASRCRILELGCGDGANLIPMAYSFADSEFLGIDTAGLPIAEGQSLLREMGLKNITLLQMNLMDFSDGFGQFDYVIAHGLYSWIPPEVQEQLLRICRAVLLPHGVAFISYNTYPGCYIRRMLREIMLFHVDRAPDPMTRIQQARAISGLLGSAYTTSDELDALLKKEWESICQRHPGALCHDDLADVNQPVYFHEFVAHAGRHGLQYLAEAELFMMYDVNLPEQFRHAMSELGDQRLLREQYLDFICCRRFRQTLLCHQEIPLQDQPARDRLRRLFAASGASVASATVDLDAHAEARFHGHNNATLISSHPVVKALMLVLIEAWPGSLPFQKLVGAIQARFEGSSFEELATLVEEALLGALKVGVLELRLHEPRYALEPGERPVVSQLARLQAAKGELLTNLRHSSVSVPDESARQLIQRMDGTKDRNELARELERIPGAAANLDEILKDLTRLALLVRNG
jgi:methyltransferase-like protein